MCVGRKNGEDVPEPYVQILLDDELLGSKQFAGISSNNVFRVDFHPILLFNYLDLMPILVAGLPLFYYSLFLHVLPFISSILTQCIYSTYRVDCRRFIDDE